jgi:uncharacterized protein (TIGR02145 family)
MKKLSFIIFIFLFALRITAQETGTYKDTRNDKSYKTVKIGKQIWMAENLAFKVQKGCWAYNDDQANVARFGYLYSWETAKSICPSGWHLPNKKEFETLINNCGGSTEVTYKAILSGGCTGLSVLLNGYREENGDFLGLGDHTVFWSSTADSNDYAWSLYVNDFDSDFIMGTGNHSCSFSVRCLKDN